jgi:hypothetical protein
LRAEIGIGVLMAARYTQNRVDQLGGGGAIRVTASIVRPPARMRAGAECSQPGSRMRECSWLVSGWSCGISAMTARSRRCDDLGRGRRIERSEQQRKEQAMSRNDRLMAEVNDELFWDPKVDNAAIAVSADDGAIIVRGTVGSLREKREATRAAQRVYGVMSVDDQLRVRVLDDARRADADLRGDVLQALALDSLVPQSVDAKVDDGFVTSAAPGVTSVRDDMAIAY